MASTRASPVVRPRICRSRNIGGRAFFAFVADWLERSPFVGVIGALVVSLLAPFRLWLVSVLPRA